MTVLMQKGHVSELLKERSNLKFKCLYFEVILVYKV